MALLEVRSLVKRYGPRTVVDGVSYHVNAGEVVGLLGPNGAGKTTSFRMTTGQVVPNGGEVWFDGHDVTRLPMFRRARRGMGYLSQEPSIFRKLSVEKNLLAILEALPMSRSLGRKLGRRERWERTDAALARFNLTHVRKNSAALCSGGEKRRLEIARCLVCEPLLILLDEPFAAVDPLTKEDIRANIRALANEGIGILLTDHDVREVLKITDRSYLIKDGKVVAEGTPEQIKRDPVAIKAYLGNTFADDIIGLISADDPRPIASGGRTRADFSIADLDLSATATPPAPPPVVVVPPPPVVTAKPPVAVVATPINIDPPAPPPVVPPMVLKSPAVPPVAYAPGSPPEPPPVLPVGPTFGPPPPAGKFSDATRQLLEHEKMRRLVELFADDSRWQAGWHELALKGQDAIPVLLEAIERRDVKIRHLAFRLLEQITGETLAFQSDAADDVRLRQAAFLRAKFDRRRAG